MMDRAEELRIRADERLKVLREVRKAASRMDHAADGDPYLWGYGASRIVAMLTAKLADQRERIASPVMDAREASARRDTHLRALRMVHQRAKLIDEWPGTDGRNVVDMIEELIRQAEADSGLTPD